MSDQFFNYSAKFTSTAGEETTVEINKLITSLASTISQLALFTSAQELEKKETLLSEFSKDMVDALNTASETVAAEEDYEEEFGETLYSALMDFITVRDDSIVVSVDTKQKSSCYGLFDAVLFSLLPLMKEARTQVVFIEEDTREGVFTYTPILNKDGTWTSLDELLASTTLV